VQTPEAAKATFEECLDDLLAAVQNVSMAMSNPAIDDDNWRMAVIQRKLLREVVLELGKAIRMSANRDEDDRLEFYTRIHENVSKKYERRKQWS